MGYIGPSFARANKNDVFTFKFTMTVADVPTTLTTPTVKAYEEGNATEFTGGITLNADYDGKTGLNELIIDTSNASYNAGKNYDFFFSAGSAGAVTLVGTGFFHLALIPDPADLRMVNGGSTGATAGKLELTQLKITANASTPAVDITNSGSGDVMHMFATGGGEGLYIDTTGGGGTGIGLDIESHGRAVFLYSDNLSGGEAVLIASDGADGLVITTSAANSRALSITNSNSGAEFDLATGQNGWFALGGTGATIDWRSVSNNDVIKLTPDGTGLGINCPVESGANLIESIRLANAANGGKTNGMSTTTAHLRDLADTKNRVTATVDSDNNRTAVTRDLT